ncbi:MAG: dihydrolipoyl dehydrogenase [Sedimentibacter sp.]|uniref:dihydrolipoyl dehydrogenase n=1 Tax=Sedimentibacter sp. TaxID=1960295 RepID=UPI0031580D93
MPELINRNFIEKVSKMNEQISSDIAVIGGGPGGYAAAILAARMGANVVLIEKNKLGGTCLNAGCIPTKALLKCTDVYASAADASAYGVTYGPVSFDFKKIMSYKNRVVTQLVGGVTHLVKANKIKFISGEGKLMNSNTILVKAEDGSQEVHAQNIILATGAKEVVIPGFEPDGEKILNSTQMLSLNELPNNLVIIGGGVIGVEFASIFTRLGVKVTIIELTDRLIPLEDEELSENIRKFLEKQGVCIYTQTLAQGIVKQSSGEICVQVKLPDGDLQLVEFDKLLVCVGRKALLSDVGVMEIGVRMRNGHIETDEQMRTNIPGLYAIGDVTLSEQLAHVAYMEARTAVFNIMGKTCNADYSAIPHCIYTNPEIASVGLSESKARELHGSVKIARFPFAGNGKALIEGHNEGFVKLIINEESEQIMGAAIIGPKATELITELTLAVQKKMTVMDLLNTVHAHPTLSEALGESALAAVGLNLHSI